MPWTLIPFLLNNEKSIWGKDYASNATNPDIEAVTAKKEPQPLQTSLQKPHLLILQKQPPLLSQNRWLQGIYTPTLNPHRHYEWGWKRRTWSISWKWGFLKRRVVLTSISPSLDTFSVQLATIELNSLSIPFAIKNKENKTVKIPALIDSRAGRILLCKGIKPSNPKTGQTHNHLKCRQHWKQTWENHLVCGVKPDCQWKNPMNLTHVSRIRKKKISLASHG